MKTSYFQRLVAFFSLTAAMGVAADDYQVYFDNGGGGSGSVAYVTNKNSLKTISIDLEVIQRASGTFSNLDAGNGVTLSGGTQAPAEYAQIYDIRDNKIYMSRLQNAVRVDGTARIYGRLMVYDAAATSMLEDTLVAYSADDAAYAEAKGYSVVLAQGTQVSNGGTTYSFSSFSPNLTSDGAISSSGGLVAEDLQDAAGDSMVRKESDGIHIGKNSVVIRDSSLNSNGRDVIYSTVGALQLGDSPAHRTIIEGTLEVPDPTAANHAASRRYVDGGIAISAAMSTLPRAAGNDSIFGVGLGSHEGQAAIALGLSRNVPGSDVQINLNVAHSRVTKTTLAAGVGWKF